MKLIALLFVLSISAIAQTAPSAPTNLAVLTDGGCNEAQISCVSQVNGIPVCPYGRVAWYPLPGQPYTIWTYPKKDQKGNAIDTSKCVETLPPNLPYQDPNFLNAAHF